MAALPTAEELELLEECGLVLSPNEMKKKKKPAFLLQHDQKAGDDYSSSSSSSASPSREHHFLSQSDTMQRTADVIFRRSVENARMSGRHTEHETVSTPRPRLQVQHFPLRMSGGTTVKAAEEDIRVEELQRKLDVAVRRINMLESLLHSDTHYHETVEMLREYQEQLNELALGSGLSMR